LIGGQSGNKILDTLYKLTSISGTWTKIDSKLSIPRRNFAAWTIISHFRSDCLLGETICYNTSCSSFITPNFEKTPSPPTAINIQCFQYRPLK
jgi:hypothetical protein